MANIFGYTTLFSTEPEIWFVDGYIHVSNDGYSAVTSPLPKEILSLTKNSTGNFTLKIQHCWYSLQHVSIVPIAPSVSTVPSPRVVIDSHNIGLAGTVDGQQGVTFRLLDAAGSLSDFGSESGFTLLLILKRSSA